MVSQLCHVFLCLLPIAFRISFDDKEAVMACLDAELFLDVLVRYFLVTSKI